MVCSRCIMVVQSELEKLGLAPISVSLGQAELPNELTDSQKKVLLENLQAIGFDILDDKKSKTIEKIKNLIIDVVQHKNNKLNSNLSDYISQELHQDYNTLSNLFTEVTGNTIEKYFIHQKIEKVKELIVYNQLTLSEIAFSLHYSSVAHLSNQFKKVTGFSPTFFKQLKDKKRKQIEDL